MEDDFLNAGFLSDEEAAQLFAAGEVEEPENTEDDSKESTELKTPVTEEPKEEESKVPESVGNEEDLQEAKNTEPKSEGSPNTSSIAQAFQEIGVLQTLDEERLKSIKTTEDLADALEEEVQNRIDEHNKRIDEALRYKMPIPLVKQYEDNLKTLDSITEDMLEEEENENYRKNLIYQDLVNKGHSKEEAVELVNDYVESGKDIEKAKRALESCKKYYTDKYDEARKEYKNAHEKEKANVKKQAEELKKSILEDDKFFKDLDINKATRQKIFDTVSKPIATDDNGTKITAFQQYIKNNPTEFYKMAGMFFVLTDGFTKIDNLIKGPVKKEVRKGIDKLNNVINSTSRNSDGSLNLRSGISPESQMNLDLDQFKLV